MATVKIEGSKVYIEGARKVTWSTGEMCEFASSLVSAMECLGEDVCYACVMGTCGAAFRFTLAPGEWDFGNYGIKNISADPNEPIRRAMAAIGYQHLVHEKGSRQEDQARITASIARGIPVLAFHVVGPSDCCIITGYDNGGEVLLGWSTFQDIPDDHKEPPDPTGYFRKTGWHDNLGGYVLIGDKIAPPPQRDIYLDALRWAVHLMRTPEKAGKCTGLAAIQAWAGEMMQEKYFPPGNEALFDLRYLSLSINSTMLRDHCSAGPFLRQVAEQEPDLAPGLSAALACYAEVYRLRDRLDDLIKDDFSEKAILAIRDENNRRAFAETLLQIRDREAEAAAWIESTLAQAGRFSS